MCNVPVISQALIRFKPKHYCLAIEKGMVVVLRQTSQGKITQKQRLKRYFQRVSKSLYSSMIDKDITSIAGCKLIRLWHRTQHKCVLITSPLIITTSNELTDLYIRNWKQNWLTLWVNLKQHFCGGLKALLKQ